MARSTRKWERLLTGKSDDPWSNIMPSPSGPRLSGRLVAESRPWEIFRALDHLGRRILFLVHNRASTSGVTLPKIAGLDVEARVRSEDDKGILSVTLENADNADIFTRFTDDIIETVAAAGDEVTAVQSFVGRTWKWHDLLKGGRKPTLSREVQLGLIGELWTLLNIIAPSRGLDTAVMGWRGSQRAPKDFELSDLCIECKARGAASRNKVRITSEHQLDDVSGHRVILLVHTFASSSKEDVGTLDLHEIVMQVRSAITSNAPQASNAFEAALEDAGHDDTHEYEVLVLHRAFDAYHVRDGFPRIVPGAFPDGPVEVAYDLPLADLSAFHMSERDFNDRLAGKD
ncbi:PD-(D/E)XK motif protein [Roseicyclus sp. F158]|uniref:PD-(D/E)XK motif protein n=1 Tax=Tropicimonas omnivorans TaxID=3075590 RepID=A0ABU3DI92_9RHOB|nr:PD-(D/E)XK motif protein [Roseicyclus sp. F158]MDT0683415.1 PD-(D/E)XK motif protein [Roseicyclus sp. F158]